MNYRSELISLGTVVAIALLLPTQARADAPTPLDNAEGQPSKPTIVEPLPERLLEDVSEGVSEDESSAVTAANSISSRDIDLTELFSTQAGDLLSEETEPTESTFATDVVAHSIKSQFEAGSEIFPENSSVSQSNEAGEPQNNESESATALAQQAQNPIANLISVPFQNNTNFGVGQYDRTSNVLNIQPVIPTSISEDWLLINRTIIPIAYQPELAPGVGLAFGLGDITYQGFFSPKDSGNFTWGVGPALVIPTATSDVLGAGKWSIGPTAVGLVTSGPIVAGALAFNVWSFAGDGDRSNVSSLTFQPFFNYNFKGGWYVTTSPIINANWLATGEKWTVPTGGGFRRTFRIGRQPVNATLQADWNVIRPEGAATWTLPAQLALLFP